MNFSIPLGAWQFLNAEAECRNAGNCSGQERCTVHSLCRLAVLEFADRMRAEREAAAGELGEAA